MTQKTRQADSGKIVVWKNNRERHIIIDYNKRNENIYYCNLLNLNDNIFVFTGGIYGSQTKIYCFYSENYKFIKSIECQNINGCFFIHKIGKINDRFFFVNNDNGIKLFKLIDIKYLEIVQCMDDFSFHINIKNNFLLEIKDNSYIKKYFNLKEGKFIKEEKMKKLDVNLKERYNII